MLLASISHFQRKSLTLPNLPAPIAIGFNEDRVNSESRSLSIDAKSLGASSHHDLKGRVNAGRGLSEK